MENNTCVIARERSDRSNLLLGLLRRHFVPPRNDEGFLLLEVLISLVIIATTLIIINRAFSISLKAVRMSGDYLLANCILEDRMFDISIKDAFADTKIADTIESNRKKFLYSLNISQPEIKGDEKDTNLKDLALREAKLGINWGEPGDISRFNVYTYVLQEEE